MVEKEEELYISKLMEKYKIMVELVVTGKVNSNYKEEVVGVQYK